MKPHQLVSEDKHSFVIRHPKGHDFTVAKAGLDQGMIAKIKAMPGIQKFADGGMVEPAPMAGVTDSMGTPQPPLTRDPIPTIFDPSQGLMAPSNGTGGAQPLPPQASAAAPADQTAGTLNDSVPQTPAAPPTPMGGLDLDAMQKTMQDAVGAQATAGAGGIRDAQAALKTYQEEQAKAAAEAQARYNAIDQELSAHMQAVSDGKIDPNRLWNQASTGNKVLAGIGIILGGIGSGLTGQPNAALQVMQNAIDRDVDAQKANLGKQNTLFSMNMQRYKNAEAAEAATRLQLGTTLQAQLQMAGMKSSSAQAQANAKVAMAQIGMQMLPLKMQLAKYQAEAPLGNGQGLQSVPGFISSDKDIASRIVHDPVTNRYFAANDADGAKKLNATLASYTPVRNILTQLQALGTTLPIGDRAAAAESLRAQLVPALNELKDTKRISEEDVKLVQAEVDNPQNWGQLLSRGTRTQSLLDNVDNQVESMKKQYIPNYHSTSDYKTRPM